MKFYDKINGIKGTLTVRVFQNGTLTSVESFENLVVDTGRQSIAKLLGGDGTEINEITKIGFGTNGSAPVGGDTTLTGVFSKALNGHSFPAINQVQFDWSLELNEANGMVIQEFGLISANDSLFSRKISASITKSDQLRLEGEWVLTI